VVEKPFGKDLCSSEALAEDIAKYYPEEQVNCWAVVQHAQAFCPCSSPLASGLLAC
jgi:Glucose-6-phosphate dehydrogenase, NAD binding domain